MFQRCLLLILVTALLNPLVVESAEERSPVAVSEMRHSGMECAAVDHWFRDQVWVKVGERQCLKCHQIQGDASDSQFLLSDPARLQVAARSKALNQNRLAFAKMAAAQEGDESRLLLKVQGLLDHGGDAVERLGRIQRHLDPGDAGLDQGFGDRDGLGRGDPAQDCDDLAMHVSPSNESGRP